jgi:hypothetical protein
MRTKSRNFEILKNVLGLLIFDIIRIDINPWNSQNWPRFNVFWDVLALLISLQDWKNNISEFTSIILLFNSYDILSWCKKKKKYVIEYTTTCIHQNFCEVLEFYFIAYILCWFSKSERSIFFTNQLHIRQVFVCVLGSANRYKLAVLYYLTLKHFAHYVKLKNRGLL